MADLGNLYFDILFRDKTAEQRKKIESGIKYRSKGFQDQPYIIVFVLLIIIDINCCFSIAILVFPAFGSILYITYGRGFEVFCIVFLSLAVFVTICNHNRHIHCQQFNLCICKYPINTKQGLLIGIPNTLKGSVSHG